MNSRLLGIGIVIPIMIISMGLVIYNSANSVITESVSTLSKQEVDAFNNQFTSYEGIQTGANIKALMGRLIGNANTYRDNPEKVPQVYIDCLSNTINDNIDATYDIRDEGDPQNYISNLGTIRNRVETKHEYYVDFTYQDNGLIDYVQISYDSENPIFEYKYR